MVDNSLYNTEEIIRLLKPEQIAPDQFVGKSHFMGSPNIFGGQTLGQSLYAAGITVPDRRPHSMHAMFLLPGNHQLPVEYEVERVRDGGTFSTRRVVGSQEGRRIFVMSASFQTDEEGLSHQKPAPPMSDPEALPSSLKVWQERGIATGRAFQPVPVDFRTNRDDNLFGGQVDSATRKVWVRAPLHLGDDPLMHDAFFAYVSDYGFLWTALQPHGIRMDDPRLQIASLDHTIWFHRPLRMDDWLLFSMESPNASGGRGLCFAHIHNRDGVLMASAAQEGLIRLRESKK